MNTHTDKTHDKKSQSVANAVAQKKSNGTNSVIVDNRPKSVLQRKAGDAISNKNSAIVDNRPKSVLQRKIGDTTSNNKENVTQLSSHPKKASGSGMERKDPGHGQVKSKQHAAAREKLDGKRGAKKAELVKRLQEKRAAAAAAKADK
jgi:hypothetical protein